MSSPAAAARAGRFPLGALLAVVATFILVVLVVGTLEFSVVWGLAGLFDLSEPLLHAGLGVATLAALALGARVAQRSWRAEQRAFGAAAEDLPPAA